jgi:arylsulfatase A-like enzyme
MRMAEHPVSRADRRPNIVILFMDDQTYRSIGALNNPEVQTPNLDRLVRDGTTFTHAFNQGSWTPAVCVPSRAMLISGLNLFHARERLERTPLWGEVLGQHGYATFMTGKWHNGSETLARSFQRVGPTGGGMYPSTADAYHRPAPGNTWDPADTTLQGHWLEENGRRVHSSERWADAAIDFLRDRAGWREQPFFMHVAFHAPHDPRQSPPEFLERYPRDAIALPPNFLPEHPFNQGDNRIRDELLAPFPRTPEAVRLHRREYYAILSHADQQIGRILTALDTLGLADDTVVCFSSDHGLAVGQHGLMGKQNQYDHSVRIPLILAGPGIPRGQTVEALVYHNSLFPTACELAGVPIPPEVETRSLLGLITGTATEHHDAVYGAYKDLQRMVRTKEHKLIVYPEARRVQLFDLGNDPWETRDLAADTAHDALIAELFARLRELQRALEDPLQLEDGLLAANRRTT